MIFEHTGHCKHVEYVLFVWWRVGVAGINDDDEEDISGKAGGKSKLDGRLEDEIDDELDDDDDDCEWRFIITPESLSLVNESLSRSDANDVDDISNVDWFCWCSVVVWIDVNAHV